MIKDFKSTSYVLLEALKEIRDEGPVDTNLGICYSLYCLIDKIPSVFESLVERWPQFSGDIAFPVSGAEVYMKNRRRGTLWQGEQLYLRMSLINFCIKELENKNIGSDSSGS